MLNYNLISLRILGIKLTTCGDSLDNKEIQYKITQMCFFKIQFLNLSLIKSIFIVLYRFLE